MFSIEYDDGWWFIRRDGMLWSPCGYRSERAAIAGLRLTHPEDAGRLARLLD